MTPTKKGLIIALLFILGAFALFWPNRQSLKREDQGGGQQRYQLLDKFKLEGVPDFDAPKTSGEVYTLKNTKAKLIVISFWATWCGPCVDEFPSLMKMAEHFKDDVVVVGISADQRRDDVDKFVKMFGGDKQKNFINLWDPSLHIADIYGTQQIPENYVVDKDFKLIRKFASSQNWSSPQMFEYLKSLLTK